MTIEIKAPTFPESVADGEVAAWHKAEGESVTRDELLVEIETDKVVLEVVAPKNGVLKAIQVPEGETVQSEQVLATMDPQESKSAQASADKGEGASSTDRESGRKASEPEAGDKRDSVTEGQQKSARGAADAGEADGDKPLGPAARKLVDEYNLNVNEIEGSGKGGRITKEDILRYLKERDTAPAQDGKVPAGVEDVPVGPSSERVERRVPMTRMRAKIAERLLHASQETAMLTTFNEVNMAAVMALRTRYRDQFQKTHNGTRLGFMGFFVKAACEALKRYPAVNASIDGDDVVYHGYQDIGVAVSTENGLVVPVMRDADFMSLADVEAAIADMGKRARENKLTIEDMTGGTFTITNGGVFGSLLSTPILNPPQTGILGMHKIQERPMAVDGEVVIQPMMNLALSYDHRLIDGKTAVQFLVAIKELIEDPARILLQL